MNTPNQREDIETELKARGLQKIECRHCAGKGCVVRVEKEFSVKRFCTNCCGEGFNWRQPPKLCPPIPIGPEVVRSIEQLSSTERAL